MLSKATSNRPVHVWVPEIEATGGIQHYSRALIRALVESEPDLSLRIFIKNEAAMGGATGGFMLHLEGVRASGCGRWPARLRTLAFAITGLYHAWRERPRYILTTHPHFAKALRLIKRFTGPPYIAVCHGIETWGKIEGPMKAALDEAALVIAVSDYTQDHLVNEAGLSADKVCVVPNTFDEHLFQPGPKPTLLLERHGLEPDQPVLVTVGRLSSSERYKGHDVVIKALPAILKEKPSVRYVIVGDGDDAPRLRQLALESGVAHATIFAGHVPREELPLHYLLADAFVMPSTGEGFGIVFLEALASGRPVIAAQSTASPQAIDGGRLGELVEPGQPDALAAAVLNVLDKSKRPELHDPAWLNAEVVRLFGFAAFKRSLASALARF
jgi:glycosyltransferase involved in cell wall biosynthesis